VLDKLPKILYDGYQRYYLNILYLDYRIHIRYAPFYHEDNAAFSYWVTHDNSGYLVERTQEFIEKWLDQGGKVVVK